MTEIRQNHSIGFGNLWKQSGLCLKKHWGIAVLACFINMLILMAGNYVPLVGMFSGLLLFPINAGLMLFFLRLARFENPKAETVFEPFKQYFRMLWGVIRIALWILLWALPAILVMIMTIIYVFSEQENSSGLFVLGIPLAALLGIPAIIASFRYAMTYYIMVDEPTVPVRECMNKSSRYMRGHKFQFFCYSFVLSLFSLICAVLTLGIALIWIFPFLNAFTANYYLALKQQSSGSCHPTHIPNQDQTERQPVTIDCPAD